jgi:hypothetical protein
MRDITPEISSKMRGRAVRLRQLYNRIAQGQDVDIEDFGHLAHLVATGVSAR